MTFPENTDLRRVHEAEATYSLDAQIAAWKAETPPERIAKLNEEWSDRTAWIEHIRVKHGTWSRQHRAALRCGR